MICHRSRKRIGIRSLYLRAPRRISPAGSHLLISFGILHAHLFRKLSRRSHLDIDCLQIVAVHQIRTVGRIQLAETETISLDSRERRIGYIIPQLRGI